MRNKTLKELLQSKGVSVQREGKGMVLRDNITGEQLHETPFACVGLGWELYSKRIGAEFVTGDTVTFCAYPDQLTQDLKAIVRGVSVDDNGRILYDISGAKVLSITTGNSLKESVMFKPFGIAFGMINERELLYNVFKSEWLTDNCYQFKFSNSNQIILIRLESNVVELFHSNGNLLESREF